MGESTQKWKGWFPKGKLLWYYLKVKQNQQRNLCAPIKSRTMRGHTSAPCNIKCFSLNLSNSGVLLLGCTVVLKILVLKHILDQGNQNLWGRVLGLRILKNNVPHDYSVRRVESQCSNFLVLLLKPWLMNTLIMPSSSPAVLSAVVSCVPTG